MTLAIFRLGSHHASLVSMIIATSYRQHIQTFIYSSSSDSVPNSWTLFTEGLLILFTITCLLCPPFSLLICSLKSLNRLGRDAFGKFKWSKCAGYSVCRIQNGRRLNKLVMLITNCLPNGTRCFYVCFAKKRFQKNFSLFYVSSLEDFKTQYCATVHYLFKNLPNTTSSQNVHQL